MADRNDSFLSTPVILAATFGAAAVLVGVLFTLKADKIETKVVPVKAEKAGKSANTHRKHIKEAAKVRARRETDAVQKQRSAAEVTPSKKKRNVEAAGAYMAPAADKVSGSGGLKATTMSTTPAAAVSNDAGPNTSESSAARTQPRTQSQTMLQSNELPEITRGDGKAPEAGTGGQSKSSKRKQRKKGSSPDSGPPASSSSRGTPQDSAAHGGGDSVAPHSINDAAPIAAAVSSSSVRDDSPPEGDEFTIVSKPKSSRKKTSGSGTDISSGNATPNQAAALRSTYSGGRFKILSSDTFAH